MEWPLIFISKNEHQFSVIEILQTKLEVPQQWRAKMCLWVCLFFSRCLPFPVCFHDSAEIPLTLFLFLCLSHFLLSHCLYLVECTFLWTLVQGILPSHTLCTAGYQCWSWLIVIQAGGMHQEEQRSIIKSFSKLWLRFLFLLKNKVYSENLILTLRISWMLQLVGKVREQSTKLGELWAPRAWMLHLKVQCIIKVEGESRKWSR